MSTISPYPSLLRSYTGSKSHWIPSLTQFANRPIVELFAGSAAISMALASSALLVDSDRTIADHLTNFDKQDVPEVFTRADFYRRRDESDWRSSLFCLSGMAFSGVYRTNSSGQYNVSAKGGRDGITKGKNGKPDTVYPNEYFFRAEYEAALARWQQVAPEVHNADYLAFSNDDIAAFAPNPVVIFDPPYQDGETQKTQTSYNDSEFDYARHWDRVEEARQQFDCVIFERRSNLEARGYRIDGTKKMRVNGSRPGDVDAMSISLVSDVRLASGQHVARKSSRRTPLVLSTSEGAEGQR